MSRPALEVADIFRDRGPAWRQANAGHVSLGQLKVMSAIERCRTAALGGHVMRCENEKCGHTVIAYNSCRNRHCPKCQGAAAREWLSGRAPIANAHPGNFPGCPPAPGRVANQVDNQVAIFGEPPSAPPTGWPQRELRQRVPDRRQYEPDAVQLNGQTPFGGLGIASCAPCVGTQ